MDCVDANDREVLMEIAPLFLEEAPKMMGKIQEAIDSGDHETLYVASHSFKGAVSHFSNKAVEYAMELQNIGQTVGDLTEASMSYQQLCKEMESLMPSIQEMATESRGNSSQ